MNTISSRQGPMGRPVLLGRLLGRATRCTREPRFVPSICSSSLGKSTSSLSYQSTTAESLPADRMGNERVAERANGSVRRAWNGKPELRGRMEDGRWKMKNKRATSTNSLGKLILDHSGTRPPVLHLAVHQKETHRVRANKRQFRLGRAAFEMSTGRLPISSLKRRTKSMNELPAV